MRFFYTLLSLTLLLLLTTLSVQPANVSAGEKEQPKTYETNKALQLMKEARENRATWDDKFPGIIADMELNYRGTIYTGKATISSDGKVELTVPEGEAKSWAESNLSSIVAHRLASEIEEPNPESRLGSEDNHPLGRLVIIDDKFKSELRIKDRKFLQINRTMGGMRVRVSVLDTETNPEGKYLPTYFVVNYFDPDKGELIRSESVETKWIRINEYDLPQSRKIVESDNKGVGVSVLKLANHRLLSDEGTTAGK